MIPPLSATLRWSVCITDADTGEILASHDEETVLKTASVGKLFALIEAARAVQAGEISADELLVRTADDMLPYISLWDLLAQDRLPFIDVCQLVAAVSDNTATNVLLRRIGLSAVQETTKSLGFRSSKLLDRVRAERTPDLPRTLSLGNARELCTLMIGLHRGTIINPAVCDQVRAWMGANVDLSMVASSFNLDVLEHNLFDHGVWLINKTGCISTARADVGLIRSRDRALAYAVIANWDEGPDQRDEAFATMAAIGREMRTFLTQSD